MGSTDDNEKANPETPKAGRGRIRGFLANLSLVVVSLAVTWGVLEIVLERREAALLQAMFINPGVPSVDPTANAVPLRSPEDARRFEWRSDGNSLAHVRSSNKNLVYELRPNVRLSDIIQINSHGFRDYEFSAEKAEDVFRIIVVGDSLTFGWYQRLEETYPKVLESLLNAAPDSGRKFEVYNMGVGGYNAAQELELLKTKALPLDPDMVIVGYCANDSAIGVDAGLWRHFTRSRSRLYDFVKLKLMQAREVYTRENILERSYAEMAAISRAEGIPVIIGIFPSASDPGRDDLAMARLCETLGLPSVNFFDAFQAAGMQKALLQDGLHPSPLGHRLAAEELHRHLAEHVL